MTRQLYDLAKSHDKISGRMVSLNTINPKNKAYSWEIKALNAVAQNADEYLEFINDNGHEYMHMLRPLRIERPCLKCHAFQGYKEGDLRGGLSIVMPLERFHSDVEFYHISMILAHLGIWVIGALGIYLGYVALARKEVARAEAENQMISLAHFDRLTGLVNRNLFHDRVKQALSLAERHHKKVGLLYIDLDRFKLINDKLGHEAGDHVLRGVGERLVASVRRSDTVARIGGDEFVAIVQGIEDKPEVALVAQKILATLQHPSMFKGNECFIGASIGISCFPDDGMDVDTLMRNADAAMYKVKTHSLGGFEFS